MKIHEIECDQGPFTEAIEGRKKCEIRWDDRGYNVGDVIMMREIITYSEELEYTGRRMLGCIDFVTNFGCRDGFVVLSMDWTRVITRTQLTWKKFNDH